MLCVTCASLTTLIGSDNVRACEIVAADALVGAPGSVCSPSYFDTALTFPMLSGILQPDFLG